MKLHISRMLIMLASTALLTSCAAEDGTTQNYYNDYFSVELKVPDKWISEVNESNLGTSRGEAHEAAAFNTSDNGDGGSYVEMISLTNTADEADDNNAYLLIYGEIAPDYEDLEGYLEYYQNSYAGDYSGYSVVLRGEGETTLGGKDCYCLIYDITDGNQSDTFTEEYYIRTVPNGFVVAYLNYWSYSDTAMQDAHEMLSVIKFTE